MSNWQPAAIARAKELFDHRTPIAEKKFLAGRSSEISRLVNAIEDKGAHAIIFGDRGVGKTSIARCIQGAMASSPGVDASRLVCIRVNCDSADSYTTLWRKVFGQISIEHKELRAGMGFNAVDEEEAETRLLDHDLGEVVTVHQVRQLLSACGENSKLVVILDEFERMDKDAEVKRLLADTIKTFADFVVPATIVFVGVGESLAHLIHEHESLTRHLVEVPVPRLGREELLNIIADRLCELGMTIAAPARSTITFLSKGLPYYIHLLMRHTTIAAIDRGSSRIEVVDMNAGFKEALSNAKQALKGIYYTATLTNQSKSLHRQCLAACALAETDQYGYFTASSVVEPMGKILKRDCTVASFNDKLVEFCAANRGQILQRTGKERSWRYRFHDPLMGPFVTLTSLEDEIITIDMLTS